MGLVSSAKKPSAPSERREPVDRSEILGGELPAGGCGVGPYALVAPAMTDETTGRCSSQENASSRSEQPRAVAKSASVAAALRLRSFMKRLA